MILSIDRVLQLLAEGKSLNKIAALAKCDESDVAGIIEETRNIINKYEKPKSKKKIIIRKNSDPIEEDNQDKNIKEILNGSELSAIPVESYLIMYIDGDSNEDSEDFGMGIVIYDSDKRQVGKVSLYAGKNKKLYVQFRAFLKALKIAKYFNTEKLKIRTSSQQLIKCTKGETEIKDIDLKSIYDKVCILIKDFKEFDLEYITGNSNEKANHLAKIGSSSRK